MGREGVWAMDQAVERSQRSQRTRDAIREAFRQIVVEGSPDAVTVTSVSERAGIHRKTFYLHYSCIEALYEDMVAEVCQQYADEVSKLPVPYDYKRLTRVFVDFYTRDAFAERLICDPRWADLFQAVSARSLRSNREGFDPFASFPPEEKDLVNSYASGASHVMFRRWMEGGRRVSPERLAELLGGLIEDGVRSVRDVGGEPAARQATAQQASACQSPAQQALARQPQPGESGR